MRILLTAINAKYIHSNLAVYHLKAYARGYEDFIEIAEYTMNQRSEFIFQEIYKKKPDVLCFSCYIWNYDYVREIAAEFHKLNPDVPIWVGGPEVSYETEKMFADNPAFFGVIPGEGEAAFAALVQYYCEGRDGELSEIAGIGFRRQTGLRETNGIFTTAPGKRSDFYDAPFAYTDMSQFENRIVYYESSRGCPFSCSYCLSSIDKKMTFRNLDLVKNEISFFIENEVLQVKFVDRTFNCNHSHAMEIWQFIKDADRGITNFHFEIAADLLTQEEILFLSTLRPGLIQLEIGVQSTNPKTLHEIRRKTQLSRIYSAVTQLQKAQNIHLHLDLIAGLPFEDYDRFKQSFRDIYALKPDQLQLGFLKVLKGSYMYENRAAYGIIYQDRPPYEVMKTAWITYDEILSVKLVEEMLEVYYNSGQFEITMKLIDVVYPDSFSFFLSLGEHYEKNGYFQKNHSRIRRAEIMLEFLLEDAKMPKDLIEESLLFDLYYRENMKSRPFWAGNPSSFKKVTKSFCKDGKLSHIEPFFYHFPARGEKSAAKLPDRLSECVYVLFEYGKRDVLSHQAKTTEYTVLEVKKQWENEQMKF